MIHIRQKNSDLNLTYIVVKTDNWTLPLDEHPSVVEHPESFEIVNQDIPNDCDYLIYES